VELFEQIRREYEFGIGTIAGVAKKLNVHRRMVREAIGSAYRHREEGRAAALEDGRAIPFVIRFWRQIRRSTEAATYGPSDLARLQAEMHSVSL